MTRHDSMAGALTAVVTTIERYGGMAQLVTCIGLVLLAGCDRPGANASAPNASSEDSTAVRAEPLKAAASAKPNAIPQRAQPAKPPCVRPMAPQPPPSASPALECPADPTGNLNLPTAQVTFPDAPGAPRVIAELAQSDAARQRGLMYRTQLDADAGMLFSWSSQQPRSFWMKNTCLPLDMLFIDESGVIVSVQEQVPTLNLAPRNSGCPAQHVLEVNAGWTREHGVEPGQKVEIQG